MDKAENIIKEIEKVISGKEEVIRKVLVAIVAGGHILLEDIPGVGKTTLALTFSKAMGLNFKRIQFTPDVVPSDITGFTMYDTVKNEFKYVPGCSMCNFLLADEINRTSSKTQSALLEVMQEGKVTVDGISHEMPKPFIVMATQNPLGTAGTQKLPEAQLDRFMIQISMGYPDFQAQVEMLARRENHDPMKDVKEIMSADELINMRKEANRVFVDRKIYEYITDLTEATRNSEYIKLGLSPRAGIAICNMAKANAYIEGRDYVVPEDVKVVFIDASRHRIMVNSKGQLENMAAEDLLEELSEKVGIPELNGASHESK